MESYYLMVTAMMHLSRNMVGRTWTDGWLPAFNTIIFIWAVQQWHTSLTFGKQNV